MWLSYFGKGRGLAMVMFADIHPKKLACPFCLENTNIYSKQKFKMKKDNEIMITISGPKLPIYISSHQYY